MLLMQLFYFEYNFDYNKNDASMNLKTFILNKY